MAISKQEYFLTFEHDRLLRFQWKISFYFLNNLNKAVIAIRYWHLVTMQHKITWEFYGTFLAENIIFSTVDE